MPKQENPGTEARASSATPRAASHSIASRQVTWEPVNAFLEATLKQANVGPLPWAGTPAWCELADGDPRKLLALAVSGEHHVLRVEHAQIARAEASRAIAGAADWPRVAREIRQRQDFRRARPWLQRGGAA